MTISLMALSQSKLFNYFQSVIITVIFQLIAGNCLKKATRQVAFMLFNQMLILHKKSLFIVIKNTSLAVGFLFRKYKMVQWISMKLGRTTKMALVI